MNSQSSAANDTIVLLHGIGRTGKSMWFVERCFKKKGYKTLNLTYPSRRLGLDRLAQHLHEQTLTPAFWHSAGRVHFVTHSMGGLVVRRYLENHRDAVPPEKLGRTVMLGPPNGGSEIADFLHRLWLYRKIFGPAGQELTTMAAQPAMPHYEAGIIAGTKSWLYPEAFFFLRGPSDGRVTVAHQACGHERPCHGEGLARSHDVPSARPAPYSRFHSDRQLGGQP